MAFQYLFIYFALSSWTDFEFYVLSFGTDDGMCDNEGAREETQERQMFDIVNSTRLV